MPKLGPPPPGTWRRGDESDCYPKVVKPPEWASIPMPRDLEFTTKQAALPFQVADDFAQENITAVIFTSPVPSHPSIWLIERVYNSICYHLPKSRIVILADGVKGTEPDSYKEFKDAVRAKGWEMVAYEGHHHHTLMLKHALVHIVKTPLIMVCEHDWGFRKRFIDWRTITDVLLDDNSSFKLIQIRQDTVAGWEYGFFGELKKCRGISLLPTVCFQAPAHIARFDWYKHLALFLTAPQNLEGKDLTFFLHQGNAVDNEFVNGLHQIKGINQMACYIPDGPMGRLYHLNGQFVKYSHELDGIGD